MKFMSLAVVVHANMWQHFTEKAVFSRIACVAEKGNLQQEKLSPT